MSSDFDPFGGGSQTYSSGEKKNNNSLVTTVLIVLLLGFAIYYGATYVLFNKVELKFVVENTEGEKVPATINVGTDQLVTDIKYTFKSDETKKVDKKKYYYSVIATDYNPVLRQPLDLKKQKELKTEKITVEKKTDLSITNVIFPESVYVGQFALLNIFYKNSSQTETYTLDDIVISGDIKDWDFTIVDYYGDPIENLVISPDSENNFFLKYLVEDTEKENNKINVRLKYRNDEKIRDFKIIEEPNISIKGEIVSQVNSGEKKNFTITINNSKNKLAITDASLTLDINSEINDNVADWFTYPQGNILIPASRNESLQVSILVPQTAKEDLLEGKLFLKSSFFQEDKEIPISIQIREPPINFTSKLNKTQIVLNYDVNKDQIDMEYLTVTLENKSSIDIDITDVKILEIDPLRKDCNNFVLISQEALYNTKIITNTNQEIFAAITAKDTSLIGDLSNNIRMCSIIVEYKHPYRTNETITLSNNFSIKVIE
jgi:hypothetical protein